MWSSTFIKWQFTTRGGRGWDTVGEAGRIDNEKRRTGILCHYGSTDAKENEGLSREAYIT